MSDHSPVAGRAFLVDDQPCPECGTRNMLGYLLVNEHGYHMHTRYVCTFWASRSEERTGERCGWSGWSVPGWVADPVGPEDEL